MQINVKFEGGPFDGQKILWNPMFHEFEHKGHLYITEYEGPCQMPKRLRYVETINKKANMKTISEIQFEQKVWADKNFPGSKSDHPLLGIIEELGELCHAQLKDEQGIRTPPEGWQVHKKDAVGDIMIYLCDYCNKEGVLLESVDVSGYDDHSLYYTTLLFRLSVYVGKLCYLHGVDVLEDAEYTIHKDNLTTVIQNIVTTLALYCIHINADLYEVLNETWAKVSQRDWQKDPTTGGESK